MNKMDWDNKQDVTMDFAQHSHPDDRTTAVITQLVQLMNLISNHLGSDIDPNTKPTTPSQKKGQQVDVVRLTAKPIAEGTVAKGFVPNRRLPSRDFTGDSISKEEEKKAMNPMTTSEGKALLQTLQEAANKLRKFLMTTRVDSSTALRPNDMKPSNSIDK